MLVTGNGFFMTKNYLYGTMRQNYAVPLKRRSADV